MPLPPLWGEPAPIFSGSQKPGPGTWAPAIGRAGWRFRRTLPAQGPGLPAAQPSRFPKPGSARLLCRRPTGFAEAGQQPGAKTWTLATGQAVWGRLRQTLPGSQKPGPGTWALAIGRAGWRLRRTLPAQGSGLPAAQPSRFPKPGSARLLCRRPAGFSKAGQQPGAKTWPLATGQALWNLSYSTGQGSLERLRQTLPGSQKPGPGTWALAIGGAGWAAQAIASTAPAFAGMSLRSTSTARPRPLGRAFARCPRALKLLSGGASELRLAEAGKHKHQQHQ